MGGHGCSCVNGQPSAFGPALVDPHLTELEAVALNRPKARVLAYIAQGLRVATTAALKMALLGFDNHDGSQVTEVLELAQE